MFRKYPHLFKEESFSYELYKWIMIHLTSRCFGKYFANVTMVPFAELTNHECSDVYYDFFYRPGNPFEKPSEFPEPR